MDEPIRYGIVGVGGFGRTRREKLREAGGFEILGGVDVREEAFLQAEKEEGRGVKRYPSVESLAADPDIEAIFVATRAHLHVEQAMIAAKAGKAVRVATEI
ncbi:MAG: Gfo/Idh/MocA family oxidoreductase [Verrucomicrobia bacterium]|nr:Gfo/Idh/MocA family oxidoreductase [Verrucomicrobiota bacterium]